MDMRDGVLRDLLTLVGRILDRLCDHGLHDCNVSIQCTADKARKQRDPICLRNTDKQSRERDDTEAG